MTLASRARQPDIEATIMGARDRKFSALPQNCRYTACSVIGLHDIREKNMSGSLVAVLALSAIAGPDAANNEAAKFLGEWKVVMAQEGGKDNEELKKLKLSFKDDKFTVQLVESRTGTFKVDPSTNPRQIDFKMDDDKLALGIYQFPEADKLLLCMADTGTKRPTEFKSMPGVRIVYLVLLRAKP